MPVYRSHLLWPGSNLNSIFTNSTNRYRLIHIRFQTEFGLIKTLKARNGIQVDILRGLSSLAYGTPSLCSPISPSPLSIGTQSISRYDASMSTHQKDNISIVDDKVENWTSSRYTNQPFEPDFTLFEPIDQLDRGEADAYDELDHHSVIRTATTLCERLIYLIKTNVDAAEELKSEISKNQISLPAHDIITQHCYNLLSDSKDVDKYLQWLDIIPDLTLQADRPIFDTHLKKILMICPQRVTVFQTYFDKLLFKGCLTNRLVRTMISHLTRTQSPRLVVSFYQRNLLAIDDRQSSSCTTLHPSDLSNKLHDHTISQLANQRYLIEALELFNNTHDQSSNISLQSKKIISPSTYRVIADQLLLRLADVRVHDSESWTRRLEEVLSRWKLDYPADLEHWLSSSQNLPKVSHGGAMKHILVRSRNKSQSQDHFQDWEDTTHRLVLYLRTILSHQSHMKFVKASHLANNIDKLIASTSIGGSFEDISQQLGYCEAHVNQEEYLKELVFDSHKLNLFLKKVIASGKHLAFLDQLNLPISMKFEGDVILIWAHSWMIYYQRSQQYHRVLALFSRYFVPLGVDSTLLTARLSTATGSGSRGNSGFSKLSTPLIHPTTGVLTVLYDSILRLTPPKSVSSVFYSFLQHIPAASTTSLFTPRSELVLTNSSSATLDAPETIVSNRLQPNWASFQPFLRSFLRMGDIESALKVLIDIHLLPTSPATHDQILDEGVWIDLLESCARQSAGRNRQIGPLTGWGASRKRKTFGWSGEMKERLVYSCLQRLIRGQMSKVPSRSIDSEAMKIFESPRMISKSRPDPIQLVPQLYSQHVPLIDTYLDQVNWSRLYPGVHQCASGAFPTLKLLRRLKTSFESCGNRRAVKIMNRWLCWRMGGDEKGDER